MCERNIKTNSRPKEFYRAGTAPPGFEIPGSATDRDSHTYIFLVVRVEILLAFDFSESLCVFYVA